MKNLFRKLSNWVINAVTRLVLFVRTFIASAGRVGVSALGENYVDSGVKILIAVVIGALLLAGLYALFNTTIMPTVTRKVQGLFNYSGH